MGEFYPAFRYTLRWEDPTGQGKVSIDSNGSRVRFGINEQYNADLPSEFWTLPTDESLSIARQRYLDKYFMPWNLDKIEQEPLACYVFDCIVNPGSGFIPEIQSAVAAVSGQRLNLDGIVGPKTLEAMNRCAVSLLLPAIADIRISYYERHSRPQDFSGLKRRAAGWKSLLNDSVFVTDIDLAT